jgi:hypothetical protein
METGSNFLITCTFLAFQMPCALADKIQEMGIEKLINLKA